MGHNLTAGTQQDDYQELGLFNIDREANKTVCKMYLQ